ncbi:MAG: uracil-DNA glycosylase [Hylemonella sp.]|uniref:uracil-DNA glycosylase n=1 Tax=Hylemonella sp. TaxID=2066020 RepID=UPI0022C280D3|nr:uracil-DNA glycosylase [Hylemonella sp.]MCZ8253074.1 uracil-DNA glycosylase [Hylemonella sp.]
MTQAALFDAPAAVDRLTAWAPTQWPVAPDWQPLVSDFFAGPSGQALGRHLTQRLAAGAVIYPPRPLRALELTPLAQVRVVILGQDPYHGPGQAEGLAFSVAPGVRPPPSLRNIHQELARDLASWSAPADGSLLAWARQGVLLLNTCLTVEDGQPASHAGHGWEVLTDQIVRSVVRRAEPAVFMLWGAHAQKVAAAAGLSAEGSHHLVLSANHPSPLSARRPPVPFLGCGHFGRAQAFLRAQGLGELVW